MYAVWVSVYARGFFFFFYATVRRWCLKTFVFIFITERAKGMLYLFPKVELNVWHWLMFAMVNIIDSLNSTGVVQVKL